ncbi:hypothetical protein E8E13_009288 [Curvularia kusanoi]|uniref:Uncharacterized protein n=1 Tax=Curvularia kusanoi TaxID=90978 RepID=A0A9P4TMF0_CURKU|nr:hypothetical protein E8E13_009288 [Curvularia kusanoi]
MCGRAYYKDGRRYWSSCAPRLPQGDHGQMAFRKGLIPPEPRQAELFKNASPPRNSRKRGLASSNPELDVKRVKQDFESPQLESKPQAGPNTVSKEENAPMCVDNNRLKEKVHGLEEKVASLEVRIYALERQSRSHGEQMNSLKAQLVEAERKRIEVLKPGPK